MGIYFTGSINLSINALANLTIKRNFFGSSGVYFYATETVNNIQISENIFSTNWAILSQNNPTKFNNLRILNNIFLNPSSCIYFTSNVYPIQIKNNLFLSGAMNNSLYTSYSVTFPTTCNNLVISNNIFYNSDPSTNVTNSSYLNNISYGGLNPGGILDMPPSGNGNVGSGNLSFTDPQMIAIFQNAANATLDLGLDNFRLQPGSPCFNAGTDGTNIGPTGGAFPIYRATNTYLTGEPPIPEIKYSNFIGNSAVQQGGTLQLEVKAKKID